MHSTIQAWSTVSRRLLARRATVETVIRAVLSIALGQVECLPATRDLAAFGALPNDAQDSAAAIQKAIEASSAGDTVLLPAGTFLVSTTLRAKSGVKLQGAGAEQTVIAFNGDREVDIFDLSGARNVELSGFTIDGRGNGKAHDGIFARTGGGHFLHHLTIQNLGSPNGPLGIHFVGMDGTHTNGVSDCMIADNTIRNIGLTSEWGGGIRLSWGSSRNQVLRNVVDNTGRGGIFADNGSMDLIIRSNTVSRSGRKDSKLGIEIWEACDRSVIEDNHLDHWLSLSGCSQVAARRNTISDTTGDIGFLGLEVIARDVVVTDNRVDGGQQIGISVSNDAYNQRQYCAHNLVQNMVQWGVQLQGDKTGARMLYFFKNQFLTTQRGNPAAIYPGADGRGFRFNGNCQQVTLDSNEISRNSAEGLELGGAGLDQISIVNNRICANAFAAVTGNPGADLEWANNTVTGNGKDTQLVSRGFPKAKPTAHFVAPPETPAGIAVRFTNRSTAPDGGIGHVLWDFGEGVPSTELNGTHTYSRAGSYRVTLVIWDKNDRGAIEEGSVSIDPK
jgi:hypothetical protein